MSSLLFIITHFLIKLHQFLINIFKYFFALHGQMPPKTTLVCFASMAGEQVIIL